jgi:ZIP family zinc transporter
MWGGISGSAVLLGALFALYYKIPKKLIGFIMAFGTGVLIGAATYELIGDSVKAGGLEPAIIGFLAGAVVFTVSDWMVSKKGGSNRKRSQMNTGSPATQSSGLGIFIGTVMDAIPESIMIGASLISGQGVSLLLVIAIFLSNIPEGLSSTVGMKRNGYSKTIIVILWSAVLVISILASLSGFYFMENASEYTLAIIASFAGGGIIAMIASTMMPEAYEEGGPLIGLMTALGLLASIILDQI